VNVLAAVWDGGGTVPVEMGVVRRLVDRGHDVRVLADPTLERAVAATGARFLAWDRAPARRSVELADDVIKDWEARTPLGQFRRVRDRVVTGPAAAYAGDVEAALREESTDVAVVDGALLGALAAAEATGTPHVALCPNIYLEPAEGMPPLGAGLRPARGRPGRVRDRAVNAVIRRMWRGGAGSLNAARTERGLPALTDPFDQWRRCDRVLVLTARAFDFPARLPANVEYVGPVLDDPEWVGPRPELPAGDEPLVVVGLSSTHMKGQRELLQRIAAALAGLPVRGVVTTGPAVDPDDIPATDRVSVRRSGPHAELFRQAALAITHAGHGTVIKALAAGVPVLGVPLGRDQADNMARVRARGAGLVLRPSASSDSIAASVQRLLADASFGECAQRLGSAIRAEVQTSRLIPTIEEVAGGHRRAA
jgi:MGT family glycosyltransferase